MKESILKPLAAIVATCGLGLVATAMVVGKQRAPDNVRGWDAYKLCYPGTGCDPDPCKTFPIPDPCAVCRNAQPSYVTLKSADAGTGFEDYFHTCPDEQEGRCEGLSCIDLKATGKECPTAPFDSFKKQPKK